jgi:hypothetical protein
MPSYTPNIKQKFSDHTGGSLPQKSEGFSGLSACNYGLI